MNRKKLCICKKGNIRVQTENIFPIIKSFIQRSRDFYTWAGQQCRWCQSQTENTGFHWRSERELGELRIDIKIDADKKRSRYRTGALVWRRRSGQIPEPGGIQRGRRILGKSTKGKMKIISSVILVLVSFLPLWWVIKWSDLTIIQEGANAVRGNVMAVLNLRLKKYKKENRGNGYCFIYQRWEQKEFLETARVIERYWKTGCFACAHFFEDKQINNPAPAWTKPSELTEEDYKNFYKELYPFSEPPLFWIHSECGLSV